MRCFQICLATLFVSITLPASDSFVTGRVVDENSAAVAEARVTLSADSVNFQTSSDPTGWFQLRLPSGEYSVTVEREGFFTLRQNAVWLDNQPQELHLVLNHLREIFQAVKVEGKPTSIDVEQTERKETLSGLNILGVPYPSPHALRNAMKLMPGVIQDASGALHFSGSTENQVLYTLDGFNVGDPLTGTFTTRLNTDMVRSIEYSTGRYSPEFGKGSAGVVAIRTEMGDDTLRYTATNFIPGVDFRSGMHLGTWSPRAGLFGPIVKGRAWFSESVDTEYSVRIVPGLPRNEQRTSSLRLGDLLRTQVNLTPGNILFTSFLANSWNAPEAGLGPLDPPPTTSDQRVRTWFFSVKDQIYLAHGMLLELGLGEDRTLTRQIPQGNAFYEIRPDGRRGNSFLDSTQRARRDQFLTNLFLPTFHLGGRHQIKVGSDLDRLNFAQEARRSGYDYFGLGGYLLSRTTFAGSGNLSRPGLEASSYVLDTWRIRSNLTADLGLRQDWDELVRRTAWSPRAALAWSPLATGSTRIAGGYAVTYDETSLMLFAQPLDQFPLTTTFHPDGTVAQGPVETRFVISHRHLRAPRYQNWSFEIDRQLPHRLQVSGNLLRRRGDHGLTYAGVPSQEGFTVYDLTNLRRDTYNSAGVSLRQQLGSQYEWMASYTRSLAQSNSVLGISADQPQSVINNVGPLPWNAPNRFLSWFYLPTPWEKWAVAGLAEMRDGFPYSVQRDNGSIVGAVNSHRYPTYFTLDFHAEYRFRFHNMRLALRGGFNNITGHRNYTAVNNTLGSPAFLTYFGSDGRHFVVRFRWLGRE